MGLASIVVAIERLLVLSKARAASMEFAAKSRALIVTGLGLVIAIVAVWMFNYLNTQFERLDMQLQHASSELIDFLEAKGGRVTKSE
jgi:biopolymer transport protein ExbB/TolQ